MNRLSFARFLCTLLIATVFAVVSEPAHQVPLLRVYMIIAAVLSFVMAIVLRERLFAPYFNRWDEAMGFYWLSLCLNVYEQSGM